VQAIAVEREVAAGTLLALAFAGGDNARNYNVARA
jgi:hypothetical protein